MFTGIIQALGSVASIESKGGDIRLGINTNDLDLSASQPGDSIAVNGVCLTAVVLKNQGFVADVSLETMGKTSLGQLESGSPVNLEKALTLNTALGGHLVSGHVDGVATVVALENDARSMRYSFELALELQHYIAEKGSVTIDGTSLTVNRVENNRFEVNIVPHTVQKTIFQYYRVQSQVNIEVDIIARYLERLIRGRADDDNTSDNQLMASLLKSGFIK
ncbi:MAG: riboflavin synthase [Gammaproteobacteria bacterium]|nr:MAG: riboflavin synthase [Gammaproteobacteria bacterium]